MNRKLDWDYSELADAYVDRAPYAPAAIARALGAAELGAGAPAVDLGAGAAHLTLALAAHGLDVTALEPNPRMRAHGEARTQTLGNVRWVDGIMEQTGLPAGAFALASFGSSFGVADREATLREAARLLRPDGWILMVFNHRDLDSPLQAEIEAFIHAEIPGYGYGPRRDDQTPHIEASGLFGPVHRIEERFTHPADASWVRAWGAHATLQRQSGERFESLIRGIARIVERHGEGARVPYFTRAWLARRKPSALP
jgi:SAM-dependent methyltransferase